MSSLSTLPKGDSAWLLRKAIERIIEQVSVLETNIGVSTSGNSANTQIIFNDDGVLRGDAGLVYNKTTDALTVAGNVQAASATITGAATVGTTLGVTSSLTVGTGANAAVLKASFLGGYSVFENSAGTGNPSITFNNDLDTGIRNPAANTLVFDAGGFEQYRIASSGVFTWSDGAGGTRMTLNSTGLGIGVAATAAKFEVGGGDGTQFYIRSTGTSSARIRGFTNSTEAGLIAFLNGGGIAFDVSGEKMRIDSSGNVGIGVTPAGTGGCLQLKSGITFPATQVASSDANCLDDYVESTFSPTIVGSTTAGTATYSLQTGRATKVGRLVTFSLRVIYTAGLGIGNLRIGNLPFTAGVSSSFSIIAENIALTAGNYPVAAISAGNTFIGIDQLPTGGGAASAVPYDVAGDIQISGSYIV